MRGREKTKAQRKKLETTIVAKSRLPQYPLEVSMVQLSPTMNADHARSCHCGKTTRQYVEVTPNMLQWLRDEMKKLPRKRQVAISVFQDAYRDRKDHFLARNFTWALNRHYINSDLPAGLMPLLPAATPQPATKIRIQVSVPADFHDECLQWDAKKGGDVLSCLRQFGFEGNSVEEILPYDFLHLWTMRYECGGLVTVDFTMWGAHPKSGIFPVCRFDPQNAAAVNLVLRMAGGEMPRSSVSKVKLAAYALCDIITYRTIMGHDATMENELQKFKAQSEPLISELEDLVGYNHWHDTTQRRWFDNMIAWNSESDEDSDSEGAL